MKEKSADILKPLKNAIKICDGRISQLLRENERLKHENKKLKANAVAEVTEELKEENKNLKAELKLSYGQFASEKERAAYNRFVEDHMHNRAESKADGGKTPYIIPYGTGIGTCLTVVCPICGEKKDITDISVW